MAQGYLTNEQVVAMTGNNSLDSTPERISDNKMNERKRRVEDKSSCQPKKLMKSDNQREGSEQISTVHGILRLATMANVSLSDFYAVLDKNTRTIEAQVLAEQLGHVLPKPVGQTMIMAISSFPHWERFLSAVVAVEWRATACAAMKKGETFSKPEVLDYGTVSCTNDLEIIYDNIHHSASGGMTISIIGSRPVILPARNVPKWNGMCILHQGGALSGCVPPSLEVLVLRGFTSTGIRFDELLRRSSKLKVLVVDSCKLMGKMLQAITTSPTIQAVVCKQRGMCICGREVAARGFGYQVYLVPEGQNSNLFWKRHKRACVKVSREKAVDAGSENRFTLRGHVYFKSTEVLSYICNTAAPASKMAEAKAKREETINQMKLLGA
uniref:DDE_Tnp_1_7 domain-containing protein n=1 Tax=Strongyloides papillosus TaxID=174720 RepID=A0A0N5C7X5_STREA